jgi:hypothetical protein
MINLQLSKEQFKSLLELVYLGNTMANVHRNQDIEKYSEIQDLMFSLAPQFGIEDYSQSVDSEALLESFEEDLQEPIGQYNEATFWEELIRRLSTISLLNIYTIDQLNEMDGSAQLQLVIQHEEKIRSHLAKFGLASFSLPE